MKIIIIIGVAACFIISCHNTNNVMSADLPVDSLLMRWENNWNNHDSVELTNMYDNAVVLFDQDIVVRNKEELLTEVIRPFCNSLMNMKHEQIQKWNTGDRVGSSGLWTVDVVENDTLIIPLKGAYTYIWKRSADGEWKVITAQIHNFSK